MNTQDMDSIRSATGRIESALKDFEDILEDSNSEALFKSCGGLVQALRHLHDLDASLMSEGNRARIEALLQKERPKSGRNSFNTGF